MDLSRLVAPKDEANHMLGVEVKGIGYAGHCL